MYKVITTVDLTKREYKKFLELKLLRLKENIKKTKQRLKHL